MHARPHNGCMTCRHNGCMACHQNECMTCNMGWSVAAERQALETQNPCNPSSPNDTRPSCPHLLLFTRRSDDEDEVRALQAAVVQLMSTRKAQDKKRKAAILKVRRLTSRGGGGLAGWQRQKGVDRGHVLGVLMG